MCLSAPGLVTSVEEGTARVVVAGVTRTALTLLTPDVRAGDWVLVGAGAVIRRIGHDEAESIERAIHAAGTPDPSTPIQRGDPS
jgi:hydrogenase expression/formation protein HypC